MVKTVRFKEVSYIGDAVNTVQIFNQLEVDELVFLDITATNEERGPSLKMIEDIASHCFMPVTYGGGIRNIGQMHDIYSIGVEKIAINSHAFESPEFIAEAVKIFGSQSVVVSIDARRKRLGGHEVVTRSGAHRTGADPVAYAKRAEEVGAGELLLTSVDRDGTWQGYDIDLVRRVSDAVGIPVIANGGAGSVDDLGEAVHQGRASAVAAGSLFVYQGKDLGVLVSFPTFDELQGALGS